MLVLFIGIMNMTDAVSPLTESDLFAEVIAKFADMPVLGIFTGHDHSNAFGVEYKGIEIGNTVSSRYNRDMFSSQYGYRMLTVDENNPSEYETKVVHWYDMITFENLTEYGTSKTAWSVAFNGFFQKLFQSFYREFASIITGRTVSYPD